MIQNTNAYATHMFPPLFIRIQRTFVNNTLYARLKKHYYDKILNQDGKGRLEIHSN